MNGRRCAVAAVLAAATLMALRPRTTSAAPGSPSFQADCEALASTPHRLAGSREGHAAVEHVVQRLRDIGMDELIEQVFPTTQTAVARCELQVQGQAAPVALQPMRPDGVILPITPPEGITGKVVDLGAGTRQDFLSTSVEDTIVVLDYNTPLGWLRAFRLGARAVIFVNRGEPLASRPHYVEAGVNLPRYYFDGAPSALPVGQTATIQCSMSWEPVVGTNVFGFLKGTDPEFHQNSDEIVVLAANLDSFGEVPRLSPGARSAANCAALLKLATYLKEHRPRRHVLIAFFDNQARCHTGASAFYRALENEDKNKKARVEEREESLVAEEEFLAGLRKLLESERPLAGGGPIRRQLLDRCRDQAREHAFAIADVMYDLRTERLELRRRIEKLEKADRATSAETKRVDEITRLLKEKWQPQKDQWNALQRSLGRDETELYPDTVSEVRRLETALNAAADDPERRKLEGDLTQLRAQRDTLAEVDAKLKIVLGNVAERMELRADELDIEKQALTADKALKALLGESWIALHISLMLGDTTPRWGLVVGGDSPLHSYQDNPGLYGKVQAVFMRAVQELERRGAAPEHFVTASANQLLPQTRILWAAPFLVHSGEIAGLFGIYNLCLATSQERLVREGTPADTLDRLDVARIEEQVDEIARVLSSREAAAPAAPGSDAKSSDDEETAPLTDYAVADQEGLSLRRGIVENKEYSLPRFENEKVLGPLVMGMPLGSSVPNTPMAGAIVEFRLQPGNTLGFDRHKPYAFHKSQILYTTQDGSYSMGPVPGGYWKWRSYGGFGTVFDDRGHVTAIADSDSYRQVQQRLNVIRCNPGAEVLPPPLRTRKLPGSDVRVLSARDNGALDAAKSMVETVDGVLSWYADERQDGVKLFSLTNLVGLNSDPPANDLEHQDIDPHGYGFPVGERGWQPRPMAVRSAIDLWRLNDSRLRILREKNIVDSSLSELHGRAEDLLLAAEASSSPLRREALAVSAFWASQPVYRKVRALVDDLVFAVLILLALAVPFAFALERVVVGATTIYRQIAWFAGFFALTFVTLYLSHPAFAIAKTPIIIFLGFAILVLSILVIAIIVRKFEVELKALQGMTSTVHAADVSRMSTLLAAIQMGISTMRRRPLRTALTAVTIILLTFTILCFASFGTQSGIVKLLSAPNPPYSGVFVHDVNWAELAPDALDVIYGRWSEDARIFSRRWICPKSEEDPGLLVTRADGSKPVTVKGVLGIEPGELSERPDLAKLFGNDLTGKVLLTEPVARALDVTEGDQILIRGMPLTVGPLLDGVPLSAAKDMDNSSVLPVDFTEVRSSQDQQQQQMQEEAMLAQTNWASLPVDSVVAVAGDTASELGANIYGIMMYTQDTPEAEAMAEDVARMLPLPVAATRDNGVYRHVLGTLLAASGATDLLFPILLGGLVIFGTMLGSVADREREIYTFSALGLAPRHVAMLFFAESMVYSLLGGMGGYLLAQATMRILTVLAEHGWVTVPEMNMSSTNTIVTILLVMVTVLISAIYPAIKASKSANPGLLRVWRPPEPQGDLLDLVFPFTVSEYDITGVTSFLKEHFDNHSDTGLGHFMASDAAVTQETSGVLGLDATLTLAPFDLGVSQSFALRSTPSEIPGIDEIRIRLMRKSGQPKDWQRLNKVFLDDLRQQFLIWRSIPHETMEIYRQRTLTALGRANAEG